MLYIKNFYPTPHIVYSTFECTIISTADIRIRSNFKTKGVAYPILSIAGSTPVDILVLFNRLICLVIDLSLDLCFGFFKKD